MNTRRSGRSGKSIRNRNGKAKAPPHQQGLSNEDENTESFSSWDSEIPVRKIPHQNIVKRLIDREYGHHGSCALINKTRKFHTNIFPNFSVCNIEKPPCFLRKFTPDGKYLVAFSVDQTSLEFYEFLGSQCAEDLVKDCWKDITDGDTSTLANMVRSDLFSKFFRLYHVTTVATEGEQLNRECSLFTDNGQFIIVGSAISVSDEADPAPVELRQNNEALSAQRISMLEHVTIHVIDIKSGSHCDNRHFRYDKIFLSHNQGLSLYKDTLAVLSIQQQTINIFQITSDGKLIDARKIGRFCHEDDGLLLHRFLETGPAHSETTINSLKHRLLVHMYKDACITVQQEKNPAALQRFYQNFPDFCKLRMWKMQLLDVNHLFIKYAGEEYVTSFVVDPNAQPTFFVVYDMLDARVLEVFRNTSGKLLELLENECDAFRNAALQCESKFVCSPASSSQARQLQQRFKQTIVNARFGGQTEAVRRLLSHLPISAQSFSTSPYLDLELFSYDDKWVSVMERPKSCGDYPIRFYARDSGLLRFRINAMASPVPQVTAGRRLVAFTFHPFEPFAISVQRISNNDYVISLHFRHSTLNADEED